MISLLAKSVRETLKQAFPNVLIKEEHYLNYKGQRLFFDFYLPTLGVFIEVQGVQHTEFTPHFHNSAENFKGAKKRDRLKVEWAELNDFTLVSINYDEIPIEPAGLLTKIEEAQHDG